MGAAKLDESDTVRLIWKLEELVEEDAARCGMTHAEMIPAVEYTFAKWRDIPRETTRAVLEDYLKNPEKYEGALKRRESSRPPSYWGEPHDPVTPADLDAAADELIAAHRAVSEAREAERKQSLAASPPPPAAARADAAR